MVDVLEIRGQPLSTLLADFMICQSCHVVDRDQERMRVGYPCPHCGVSGNGARGYFSISVHSLIDLMQEFYHMKEELDSHSDEMPVRQQRGNHRLAVVIFFCTLGEVLLAHFLEQLMSHTGLSRSIQERLLNDNIFVKQRVEKLFPALTGVRWKVAVKTLTKGKQLDYLKATEFYEEVVEKRNLFLHKGNKWAIPKDMPENCVRQIWPLVNLFVGLHNKYVVPVVPNNLER
jgi:hypothetical protein